MQLLFAVVSLFALVHAVSISEPLPGTTFAPGETTTVRIIESEFPSPISNQVQISLIIGIVACGTSACPLPSDNLGDLLFIGKFQSSTVTATNSFELFEDFSVTIPTGISGAVSIQVQLNSVVESDTQPGFGIPRIEYASVEVQVGSGLSGILNIHPVLDSTKCVGIIGGVYGNGSPVDIFDCNQSNSQKWQWNGNSLLSVAPDSSQWCLDSGVQSTWTDGLEMKIWECLPNLNLPQQNWTPDTSSGNIKLTIANFCLDLTDGIMTNQNVLQIWECAAGNVNQIWTVTSA